MIGNEQKYNESICCWIANRRRKSCQTFLNLFSRPITPPVAAQLHTCIMHHMDFSRFFFCYNGLSYFQMVYFHSGLLSFHNGFGMVFFLSFFICHAPLLGLFYLNSATITNLERSCFFSSSSFVWAKNRVSIKVFAKPPIVKRIFLFNKQFALCGELNGNLYLSCGMEALC